MPQRIAGIYEIERKIGSGGGGIVYLGRHVRLEKQIVLKADKRTLDTKPEKLRREVDMLKNLSHTYIPQVYDFVQEDGVVYTIMDFIEGESLDKRLKRGELPSQPQVIQWACQILEALVYLHRRPPHGILHGDIKPANIMLRPNGDVCLIDYNIALVLGENGAVKVGRSRGYASPEHYGIEYASGQQRKPAVKKQIKHYADDTETMEETETMAETQSMGKSRMLISGSSSDRGQHPVTLDARSDIYSLGATLYHLLSGKCPEQDALAVEPLTAEVCSPQVAKIIQKAMAPSADMRYQTAEEMLNAFQQLHRRDRKAVRHRQRIAVSAILLSILFLSGGACTFAGLRQMEQVQASLALAEYSANALAQGNVSGAVELALQAIPEKESVWNAPVTAEAQKALADALGVYDLSEGFKALDTVELPAAPYELVASPKGSRFAVVYSKEAAIMDTGSKNRTVVLPIENSALADVQFLDEDRIIYAGDKGVSVYDLNEGKVLWTGERATTLAVSGDHAVAAAVNRSADFAVLYRVSDGKKLGECVFHGQHMQVAANDIFADPGDSIFALNHDGSMLAVSFAGGGLRIFDWKNPDNDLIIYDESEYMHFEGGFCGPYFAFAANGSGNSLFGVADIKEAVYLGGHESQDNYMLRADEEGIWLANGNLLVRFDPKTLEEKELAYTDQENITGFSIGEEYVLTTTDAPGFSFFDRGANLMQSESSKGCDFAVLAGKYALLANRDEPSLRVLVSEDHEKELLLSYDARYAHDEARLSQDEKTAVFFNYQGFRVYDMDGNILAEVKLPDAEQIYDQQFRRGEEDSWLEVIWYDGTVRCYRADDGTMRSETAGTPPEPDLYEEFYTEKYRISSSLHQAPEVYERKTGRKAASLEEEAYLTYVTQVGEYIITEYIRANGERYGLVLDQHLQTIACLPNLCDIVNGKLVFDYPSGNLRQCRLYSLQELKAFGENYKKEHAEKGKERTEK